MLHKVRGATNSERDFDLNSAAFKKTNMKVVDQQLDPKRSVPISVVSRVVDQQFDPNRSVPISVASRRPTMKRKRKQRRENHKSAQHFDIQSFPVSEPVQKFAFKVPMPDITNIDNVWLEKTPTYEK